MSGMRLRLQGLDRELGCCARAQADTGSLNSFTSKKSVWRDVIIVHVVVIVLRRWDLMIVQVVD